MKTSLCYLFILSFIVLSCSGQREQERAYPYDQEFLEALVLQTNQQSGLSKENPDFAFHGQGSLESQQKEEILEGVRYEYLSFKFTGNRADESHRKVYFEVDLDAERFPFPPFIANVAVTYLGDQLLIRDLDSDYSISFLIDQVGVKNLVPKIDTERVGALRVRMNNG